ncbi:MAG TPA: transcription antitermination factor NusB [Fredinandcohnia sp.]|nr:transcription antitermination factor NusB [Fredinandcohnia sp.]
MKGIPSMRHVGRSRAVQALFSLESGGFEQIETALAHFWESLDEPTPRAARRFAEELVRGVVARRARIDEAIQAQSESWKLERMARVDRNVLRLGAYEILFTDTPAKVIINEAIEIARTFGAEGSPAFVNGILDKLAREAGRL